jgi:hypothetical protein
LPVVLGKKLQLITCRGCARGDETDQDMLERLTAEAEGLGAQDIDDKILDKTYGIRLYSRHESASN